MTAASRIYVTDCEGPLTRNDNAQEIAAEFLPDGAELFARLSKYDDCLADVLHRPGYNAGDTLRLLPPFLRAFGVGDDDVVRFSAENVLVVPGAPELLRELRTTLPCFIISTSYTPYIRALCDVIGFPFVDCRCTTLSLDAWRLPAGEAARLREWAERIVARPLIDLPEGAASLDDLSERDRAAVRELDELFWDEMAGDRDDAADARLPAAGRLLRAVRPVGGGMKLAALEELVAETGCGADQVMYVGDSITDAPPLSAVRSWGGAAVSFNGNGYALAAAEIAAAGPSVEPVARLARAFVDGGPDAARRLAADWPAAAPALRSGVERKGAPAEDEGRPAESERRTTAGEGDPAAAGVAGLVEHDRDRLTAASLAARKSVRGERIAKLG